MAASGGSSGGSGSGAQARATAEFVASLRGVEQLPEEQATPLLRQSAQTVAEGVIVGNEYGPGTPVDTGWARANWFVSVGAAEPGRHPRLDPAAPAPTQPGGAAAEAAEAVTFAALAIVGAQLGQPIHIVNDVPYIEALNDGHSRQAPAGMVDPVVAQWDTIVDREGAKLGIHP